MNLLLRSSHDRLAQWCFQTAAMQSPAVAQATRQLKWYLRLRDAPELAVLGGLIAGVLGLAGYTVQKTLLNNEAGSYPSIAIRGDAFKQVETARGGISDAARGTHSLLWHVAQIKVDQDGANIGVTPFNNRVHAQQYGQPGAGLTPNVSPL